MPMFDFAGQTHIGVVKIFVNYPIFMEQTYPALDALLLIPITCDYVFFLTRFEVVRYVGFSKLVGPKWL